MKRKLLSILLTLCLAFSLLPTAALAGEATGCAGGEDCNHQAAIENTHYDTLVEAVSAAKNGETIRLLADVTNTDYTVANVVNIALASGVTLDGNGKTLSGNVEITVASAGGVTIKNVAFKDIHNDAVVSDGYKKKYGFSDDKVGTLSAIYASDLTGSLTITGCEFDNCDWEAMQITPKAGATISIKNNVFKNSASDVVKEQLRHVHVEMAYGTGYDCEGEDINLTVTDNQFLTDTKEANMGIWWVGKASDLELTGNYYNDPDAVSITLSDKTFNRENRCDLIYPARSTADVDQDDLTVGAAMVIKDAFNAATYSTLADAFANVETGDTVKLLDDITLTEQVNITKALNGLTLDGNGKTITCATTDDPFKSGGSALYFGNADSKLYCTGIKIKDLTMTGTARFAIFLCGGTTTEFTNVNISGNYYIAVNLYGTHGATMTNCNISNSTTGTDKYISGIWSNVASQNPLTLNNTKVDTIAINAYTTANTLASKIYVMDGSEVGEIHTFDDGSVSGNKKLCVSTESTGSYTVKEYDETSSTWVEVPDVAVVIRNGREIGCATFTAAIAAAQNGDTVKLLEDVDENVTIPAGKTITLDLNGFTINGKRVKSTPTLTVNGRVTVKDSSEAKTGTIKREDTADNSGISSHYVIDIQGENASLTFESGNVTNGSGIVGVKGASLVRVGNDSNTSATPTLTINGGKFTQDNFIAIKVDYGTLNVNGGEINSANSYAIENWKDAYVTGGTINGAVASWTYSGGTDSITTISGGTINGSVTSVNYGDATGKKATVNISGNATVKGNLDTRSYDPKTNELTSITDSDKAAIAVSGGSFSTDLKDTGYLANSVGAEVKSADGSTYGYYATMDDAMAAAKPGDTVTDLKAQSEESVTVTLDYNGGGTNTTITVAKDSSITLPTPTRSGYTFNGWYDGSTKVSDSYTASANVTLTASWSYISSGSSGYYVSTPSKTENGTVTVSPRYADKGDTVTITVKPDSGYVLGSLTVTDSKGNELTLTDKGNGKYTFTMPSGRVEVKASFAKEIETSPFADVATDAYYYEAVKWAVKNGITTGVGDNLFAPGQPCTRAQIVTFLWRAAGSPEPKGTAAGMTDVVSGSYYEKAVAWAIENGVTTGTTATTFSPDATCTRAQAVTFLARALNAKAASAAEFSDVPTDSYFAEAVAWAASNGVTEGVGNGLFAPDNDCTRGQIVTFLYRAYNK